MNNTLLLWDFDGTLAYRDGMWTASLTAILHANGYRSFDEGLISKTMQPHYPWSKNELGHNEYFKELDWWGYIQKHVVGRALSAISIDGDENARLASRFRAEFLRLGAWYLFDDTITALDTAKDKGCDCVILSNHTPELRQLTDYLGITHYFGHIITSADVGYEKPNPKFYDITKSFENYDRYYMIGDNYNADILGARDYGFDAILVRRENSENYPQYSSGLDGIWKFIK